MCNCTAECVGLHVVREATSTVDLDDGNPCAVRRFQRFVACDVDLAQLEVELLTECTHLLERAVAQVAALRVINGNVGQLTQTGYG